MEAVLRTNREIASHQIADCLTVIGNLSGYLSRFQSVIETSDNSVPKPVGGAVDGGVQAALEATIIKACARMDQIFETDAVWSLPVRDGQEIYERFANVSVSRAVAEIDQTIARTDHMVALATIMARVKAQQQEAQTVEEVPLNPENPAAGEES
jgi:hypothetical protein